MFSQTVPTAEWPGLEAVSDDEIRVIGSLSIVRELAKAGALDTLRLIICPLALPDSGIERVFEGMGDIKFNLQGIRTLDDRIVIIDYGPDGTPLNA